MTPLLLVTLVFVLHGCPAQSPVTCRLPFRGFRGGNGTSHSPGESQSHAMLAVQGASRASAGRSAWTCHLVPVQSQVLIQTGERSLPLVLLKAACASHSPCPVLGAPSTARQQLFFPFFLLREDNPLPLLWASHNPRAKPFFSSAILHLVTKAQQHAHGCMTVEVFSSSSFFIAWETSPSGECSSDKRSEPVMGFLKSSFYEKLW